MATRFYALNCSTYICTCTCTCVYICVCSIRSIHAVYMYSMCVNENFEDGLEQKMLTFTVEGARIKPIDVYTCISFIFASLGHVQERRLKILRQRKSSSGPGTSRDEESAKKVLKVRACFLPFPLPLSPSPLSSLFLSSLSTIIHSSLFVLFLCWLSCLGVSHPGSSRCG